MSFVPLCLCAWKNFLAAIQFLTVFPLSSRVAADERELGRSVAFFPLIGLLIGAVVVVLDFGLNRIFPTGVASVLVVLALLAVSGGFHMDGLADTADGFLSSRPRERILEIMKDSRIGAMGVVAMVGVLALKMAALASIPKSLRVETLLLMPLVGRGALVLGMSWLPCARPESGLGALFARHRLARDVPWTVVFLLVTGFAVGRFGGVVAVALAAGVVFVFSRWCWRKIGGFTGDTLGAACELAEIVPVLLMAARVHLNS